jgi:hypothetical protein
MAPGVESDADAAKIERPGVLRAGSTMSGVELCNAPAGNVTAKTFAVAVEIVVLEAQRAAWAHDLRGEVPAPAAMRPPMWGR